MLSKNRLIAVIILIVLTIGLVVGVILVRQNQELRKDAAPATTISLKTLNPRAQVGESINVDIGIDTGTNTATATDLEISYDSSKLTLLDFKPGIFLPVPLSDPRIDNARGVATASFGAQPANPPKGKGSLGTLVFQAKEPGTTQVSFAQNTIVTGIDEETDVTVGRTPVTITITSLSGSTTSGGTQTATTTDPSSTTASGGTESRFSTTATASPTSNAVAKSSASPSPSTSTQATATGKGGTETASPSPSATASTTKKSTSSPAELPAAGVSWPTITAVGAGVAILFLGIFLAF